MKRILISLGLAVLLAGGIGCKGGTTVATDEHGHAAEEHAGEAKVEEGHVEEEGEHSEDIVLTADAAKIAGIETAQARRIPIQAELKVAGVVTNTGQGRAVVTPPVAGKITKLHISMGDTVRAGQAIATLQSSDLAQASAAIVQAQRDVITAEAGVRDAQSQVDLSRGRVRTANAALARQKEFARTGAFSQPAVQQAQRELNEAQAELENSLEEQKVHDAQLERAERLFKQELISRTELEQARLEVQQDRIRQEKARRTIAIATQAFERERAISDRGLLVSREIQSAEGDVRAANLEVQQARIRLNTAISAVKGAQQGVRAARLSYSALAGGARASGGLITVVAPIGGVITHREATLGQAVERTTEICEVENLSSVWVTANVPEKDIAQARLGSAAQVRVTAYPNRIFPGVVKTVGSRLDPKTRTMPVQVLVDNRSGALRADMFATVSLGVGTLDMALAIPRSAVVEDGDRRLAYIAEEGGKYEERVVQLGRTKGNYIEVVAGLEPGVTVVSKGAFVLKSEKVKAELKGHEH